MFVDAEEGNPAVLIAPNDPGSYEIWYVLGGTTYVVRASLPLEVN